MKDCQAILDLLPLYFGGDLDATDLDRVTAHLEICPACRTEAEAWRTALRGLEADFPPDLDPALLDAMARTAARSLPAGGSGRATPASRRPRTWISLAAAAVVAGLLLWPDLRPSRGPTVPPTILALQDIFQGCLEFPVPLAGWQAEPGPGVVTVLAPAGQGGLRVAACIEAADLSRLRSYPWARQRIEEWSAGSSDSRLLVAVCRTPEDAPAERRTLRNQVIARFLGP